MKRKKTLASEEIRQKKYDFEQKQDFMKNFKRPAFHGTKLEVGGKKNDKFREIRRADKTNDLCRF